jgi:hypothetical protein
VAPSRAGQHDFQNILTHHPGAFVGDADLDNFITGRIEGAQDGARRHERHLMLT